MDGQTVKSLERLPRTGKGCTHSSPPPPPSHHSNSTLFMVSEPLYEPMMQRKGKVESAEQEKLCNKIVGNRR